MDLYADLLPRVSTDCPEPTRTLWRLSYNYLGRLERGFELISMSLTHKTMKLPLDSTQMS